MMKLSQFILSRNVLGRAGTVTEAPLLQNFVSRVGISSGRQDSGIDGNYSGGIYADYSIFKGKAALSMYPMLPTFTKLDSGNFKVDRMGAMMLKFWPAIGQHKYDWQKRQVFALSPTEVGSLISLGPNDSCEFFHDPSMKTSIAGQVRKSLSVTPLSTGGGYFLTLTVVNNNLKTNERFSVPVTNAEFAVMRTAFSFVLPHIMGWDQYSNQLRRSSKPSLEYTSLPSTSMKDHTRRVVPLSTDSEWDK